MLFSILKEKKKKLTWPALRSAFTYASVSVDDYTQYFAVLYFSPDVSFITSVTFTTEKFYTDILIRTTKTFKQLEKKIKYNVSLIDN